VPAQTGKLTYARFYVEGDPPDDFRQRFMRSIRHRAMRPLELDEEELERSGWCQLGEPFTTELAYDDVFLDEYINVGFRTDRWALPTALVRRKAKEAERAYVEKKGRALSRHERKELKLMVTKKLRREISPTTRLVDLSWSLGEGVVRFFSHANKPAAAMTELFTKTFGLKLVPESPYTLAARLGITDDQAAAWNALEPLVLGEQELLDIVDAAAEEE
jgi:recombination associated protein RdgC